MRGISVQRHAIAEREYRSTPPLNVSVLSSVFPETSEAVRSSENRTGLNEYRLVDDRTPIYDDRSPDNRSPINHDPLLHNRSPSNDDGPADDRVWLNDGGLSDQRPWVNNDRLTEDGRAPIIEIAEFEVIEVGR
jgi:hypothetical protein